MAEETKLMSEAEVAEFLKDKEERDAKAREFFQAARDGKPTSWLPRRQWRGRMSDPIGKKS